MTARRTRVGVRGGRTVSMPSRRPVNGDVTTSDTSERRPARLMLATSAATTPKFGLGQLKEVMGAPDDVVSELSGAVSSPRTEHGDCSLPSTNSRRRMSHVTPDFDPSPPRRFDDPLSFSLFPIKPIAIVFFFRRYIPRYRD